MKGRAWNAAAIALLGLIAGLVYFMPRFNYDVLVRRQATVESGLNTTLERIETVESVVEVGSEKRSAALKALDGLPERLKLLQEKLSELSDQTAVALGELVSLDAREVPGGAAGSRGPPGKRPAGTSLKPGSQPVVEAGLHATDRPASRPGGEGPEAEPGRDRRP